MQAGSELSGGLGLPTRMKPPKHTARLDSGANIRKRKTMLPSPKEKNWSWCAKNVEVRLEASTMMTAWPWDAGR